MDRYTAVVKLLEEREEVRAWPQLRELVQRTARARPADWRLPELACRAVGGEAERALPAVAAIACLQTSILLVDDMLDHDPRGEYQRIGAGAAANLAAALQAAGAVLLTDTEIEPTVRLRALQALHTMALATALGQQWDSENPREEEAYWRLVRGKSAPFYGTALYLGALMGGAPERVATPLRLLGGLYGEVIQLHDDLSDALVVPAGPDWLEGRASLPLLFAEQVPHPEQERFCVLRAEVAQPRALMEAQQILVRCGALSYTLHQIMERHARAATLLATIPLPHPQELKQLLEAVSAPVHVLLQAASAVSQEVN